jgi:hypothetical protein
MMWTAERRQELQERLARGERLATIAAAFGCDISTISKARVRFGLKTDPKPGEQLARQIQLHCTAEMARLMDEQARKQGRTMSSWVRSLVVSALQAEGIALPPLPPDYRTPARSRMIHRPEDHVVAA